MMWQYGWIKKPRVTHNIVWTGTSIPSGTPTEDQIKGVIQNVMDSGQVPNADNFGELFPNGSTRLDYRHIYVVWLPPGKLSPVGGGYATNMYRNQHNTSTPKGTVWWMMAALNPPDHLDSRFPQFNEVQMAAQGWAHEVLHKLESAMTGGCNFDGFTGWLYNANGECNGLQHARNHECALRLRVLSGTNVPTESIWSDQDGRCVAPGTGDSWTRPPAGAGGTVPSPSENIE